MRITLSMINYLIMKNELLKVMERVLLKPHPDYKNGKALINTQPIKETELPQGKEPMRLFTLDFVPEAPVASLYIAESEILPKRGEELKIRHRVNYYLRDPASPVVQINEQNFKASWYLHIDCCEVYSELELDQRTSLNLAHLLANRTNNLIVDRSRYPLEIGQFIKKVEGLVGQSFFEGKSVRGVYNGFENGFRKVDRLLHGWQDLKEDVGLQDVDDHLWKLSMLAAMPLSKLFQTWNKSVARNLIGDPFHPTLEG